MKAHIVGGGFGGLAAAGYLILNAKVPGQDITIYEADERMGGGFFLGGSAQSGYNLPGSVFDSEFRCAFALLDAVPCAWNPPVSVKKEFFTFNEGHLFDSRGHLIDGEGRIVHGPRFGLSWRDGFDLARLALTPERKLEGRRIREFFSPRFFSTEFWLCYSTIMGSLPQHGATELRRYLNRTLHMLPYISDMANIWRTPINQYQAFIEPLVAWLRARGVNLQTGVFVQDVGFAASPGRITVNRLDYERDGAQTSVTVARDDLVLLTFGSQAADMSVGSMSQAPPRRTVVGALEAPGKGASGVRQSRRVFWRGPRPGLTLGILHSHHDRDGVPGTDVRTDGQRDWTRRAGEFDRFALAAVAVDFSPAGNNLPAARHIRLVGLRLVSGKHWQLCEKRHG